MGKDILKSSLIYTILGFLPLSFAFVFTPIYLTYLSDAQYGILNLFMLYSGIIALIYHLGVTTAFGYIYWDVYKDKEKLKNLISSTLGLIIIFQVIFISLGLVFGQNIVDFIFKSEGKFTYNPIFITTLFFSAFLVFYEMFINFFRNEHDLKKYAIINISTLVLLTIGTFAGVVFLDMKEVGAIYGRTFGYGFVIIFFIFYFIKKYGIKLDLSISKMLLAFGIPLFFNALIGALSYGIDRIIIERFDTLQNLGIYGFTLVIISVVEILFSSLNNALSPTLFKFILESPIEKRREIKGITHSIILIITAVITIIIACLYPIFDIIIPENFHRAALFVPILGFGFIWRVFTTISSYSLYIEKKTKYLIFNQSSNLVLTVGIGYVFYQIWDIMGIVITMYLARLIEYIIMRTISYKVKKLSYELDRLIQLTLILSASGFFIVFVGKDLDSNLKYILYCIPLVIYLISFPLFLRKEKKNLIYLFKHRKTLF